MAIPHAIIVLIAGLFSFVIQLLIVVGPMTIPVTIAEIFSKKFKKKESMSMKPKDLLEYLESGDRTMEDLAASGKASTAITTEGSISSTNPSLSRYLDPYIQLQNQFQNASLYRNMQDRIIGGKP